MSLYCPYPASTVDPEAEAAATDKAGLGAEGAAGPHQAQTKATLKHGVGGGGGEEGTDSPAQAPPAQQVMCAQLSLAHSDIPSLVPNAETWSPESHLEDIYSTYPPQPPLGDHTQYLYKARGFSSSTVDLPSHGKKSFADMTHKRL